VSEGVPRDSVKVSIVNSFRKEDSNMPRVIDRTITWRFALPYILILIESHAKKSYTDCGVDESLKACLTDLVNQHEELAKFYADNQGKDGVK